MKLVEVRSILSATKMYLKEFSFGNIWLTAKGTTEN